MCVSGNMCNAGECNKRQLKNQYYAYGTNSLLFTQSSSPTGEKEGVYEALPLKGKR